MDRISLHVKEGHTTAPETPLRIEEMLLAELEPRTRQLFITARGLECGCSILRFLNQRGNLLMTVDDIAYNLGTGRVPVEQDLQTLFKLGLVSRVNVVGVILFGLTEDPQLRCRVRDLCRWQDDWHLRLSTIEGIVDGQAIPKGGESPTPVIL